MRAEVSQNFHRGKGVIMSAARKMLSEGNLFNQVAMFSVAGLSTSMAMVIVGGLQVIHPWY